MGAVYAIARIVLLSVLSWGAIEVYINTLDTTAEVKECVTDVAKSLHINKDAELQQVLKQCENAYGH